MGVLVSAVLNKYIWQKDIMTCARKCGCVFLRYFLTLLFKGGNFMLALEIICPLCKRNELVQHGILVTKGLFAGLAGIVRVCTLVTQAHYGASLFHLLSGRL